MKNFILIQLIFILCIFRASSELTDGPADSPFLPMPNGLWYHRDCIHTFDEQFEIEQDDLGNEIITDSQNQKQIFTKCKHQSYTQQELLALSSQLVLNQQEVSQQSEINLKYYSSWTVYTKTVREEGFGGQFSNWTVPEKPESLGPFPPLVSSSIYIFNGLEDGAGVSGASSLIMQPVLQHGKSGCLLNPFLYDNWYMTAYYVSGSGRAYCGPRLGPLQPGETVFGNISLIDKKSNKWNIQGATQNGQTSNYQATLSEGKLLNAAYATLEAMIIYNCKAYPKTNNTIFGQNQLTDIDGNQVDFQWTQVKKHTECDQNLTIDNSSNDVTISWNPDK